MNRQTQVNFGLASMAISKVGCVFPMAIWSESTWGRIETMTIRKTHLTLGGDFCIHLHMPKYEVLVNEPIRAQNLVPNESNKAPIVGGVLMGKLSARSIDIRDTFEVPLGIVDGDTITSINTEYLHNKAEHLTQVSDNEVLNFLFDNLNKIEILGGWMVQNWIITATK